MPSEHFLPRRHEYTRVYTTVYPRVHNCIHACTQVRSKYLLSGARLYVCFLGIMPRISRDRLRLSLGYEAIPPRRSKGKRQECASEIMRRPCFLCTPRSFSLLPQAMFFFDLRQRFLLTQTKLLRLPLSFIRAHVSYIY